MLDMHSKNLRNDIAEQLLSYQKNPIFSEADFYGASRLIATCLQYKKVPKSYSSWFHGCHMPPFFAKHEIIWEEASRYKHLVPNREIAEFLAGEGVENVHAVGVPYLYTSQPAVLRQPGSVLLMPAHSLSYVDIRQDYIGLLELAKTLEKDGYSVSLCLHQDCIRNESIINEIDQAGIAWFAGASVTDSNSLQRMRNIFSYFEYVGSNTLGSHFFYAQLSGAKFFFFEPYFQYSFDMFANDPFWMKHPGLLEKFLSKQNSVKEIFSAYFGGVGNALTDYPLATKMCGAEYKITEQALAKLLGWEWDGKLWGNIEKVKSKLSIYRQKLAV